MASVFCVFLVSGFEYTMKYHILLHENLSLMEINEMTHQFCLENEKKKKKTSLYLHSQLAINIILL